MDLLLLFNRTAAEGWRGGRGEKAADFFSSSSFYRNEEEGGTTSVERGNSLTPQFLLPSSHRVPKGKKRGWRGGGKGSSLEVLSPPFISL